MKEINHIIHAFLLFLVSIVVFICLKTLFTSPANQPESDLVLIDDISVPDTPSKGKLLFMAKCASCHILGKDFTGPSLCGFEDREPWSERENVYQWIRNPQEFMKKNEYATELGKSYSAMMMSFPNLTNAEIDEIINYINNICDTPVTQGVAKN